MSEYWKSTPKYWCKHCKTYVRDTKLEKTNHEATPKHQGNLKRFLRDLHRGHEKDEKDKERAKAEVARLNGLGSGASSGSSSMARSSCALTHSIPKPQATSSQRKQQLAQLADMGVAIPDEFRPDMAMVGEWQVTSERMVEPEGEKKPEALALGVRKREPGDEDDEELEAKKRRWGSAYRSHPMDEDDGDLDALLSNATRKEEPKVEMKTDVKEEPGSTEPCASITADDGIKRLDIKKEPSDGEIDLPGTVLPLLDAVVKQEGGFGNEAALGVVFKKRKAKNIRQK